jgi:hypothetical protein
MERRSEEVVSRSWGETYRFRIARRRGEAFPVETGGEDDSSSLKGALQARNDKGTGKAFLVETGGGDFSSER